MSADPLHFPNPESEQQPPPVKEVDAPTLPGVMQVNSLATTVIAVVAVGAALYYAQLVCVILLISVLLAFVLEPLVRLLMKIRVPRTWAALIAVLLFVFGVYMVLHGQLSPGGGFQGGVILATVPLHLFLSGGYRVFRPLTPEALIEVAEAAGAGAYVVVGLGGMLAGIAFLQNVLPLGETGSLVSGGTIMVINVAVGLEVSAGFVLLLSAFLRQLLRLRRSGHAA